MIYLDSCALIKLIIAEAESSALIQHLSGATQRIISSEIAITEVHRALIRLRTTSKIQAAAEELLADTLLLPIQSVLAAAGKLPYPGLRSLDALHLATAQDLGGVLTSFITYDKQLAKIAQEAGMHTFMPRTAVR